MARPQLWQLGVLIFASIASSRCSFLPRGLECPLQGTSFGGRLVFMNEGGLGSSLYPSLAHRGRMIIFQSPPADLRPHMAYGRGKIWIGSRNCQGSDSQPDHCPWSGDRPCLDKGIPCVTEAPSYAQSHPLEFSDVTEDSITVSWPAWNETTDLGIGPLTGFKILYRQLGGIFQEILLDGDSLSYRFDGLTAATIYQFRIVVVRQGEPPEGPPSTIQNTTTHCTELGQTHLHVDTSLERGRSRFTIFWQLPNITEDCQISRQEIILHQLDTDGCASQHEPREFVLQTTKRARSFRGLDPNSLFNITYIVTNPAGTYMTSQVNRTAEKRVPPGAPSNLQHTTRSDRVVFEWNQPSCGERNGKITKYMFIASKNGENTEGPRRVTRYALRGLSSGDEWTFKVKACNGAGCGPYAEESGVIN